MSRIVELLQGHASVFSRMIQEDQELMQTINTTVEETDGDFNKVLSFLGAVVNKMLGVGK